MRYHVLMEHALRHALYDLVGDAPTDALRAGADVAMLRLLRAPYFEGGHDDAWALVDKEGRMTLAQHVRGDWKDRGVADLYLGSGQTLYKATVVDPSAEATQEGERLLTRLAQTQPVLWQRLMSPTPEQLTARHQIHLELLDDKALDGRLAEVLGETYRLDGSLATQGIEYHSAPSWNDGNKRYVLAHNGEEIAGILCLSAFRDWTYGVNYLAVAPGFRQQGVGRAMFARAIEECVKDGKVLVRTAPGEFAAERTAIPGGFDRQCQDAPTLLHVQSNSYLMSALGRALEQLPLAEVVALYKPVCDRFDAGDLRDRMYDPELVAAVAEIEKTMAGTGNAPGTRAKRSGP